MKYDALREAGLTDGEIKTYLALLKLGSTTSGPIVDESGIARSIIYQILEKLVQKGLVSYITKEKTKYYQAAEPKRLLDYIEERQQSLEANKIRVMELLPQLQLLLTSSRQTEVRVFEGFKGLITVHERTYEKLAKGEEYFYMGLDAETPGYQQAYWKKDHQRRIKAGIKTNLLFQPDYPEEEIGWRAKLWGCETRIMHTKLQGPAWFMGYKDVTVIGLQANPIAIEISNQQIADSFHAYFEEFWQKSKPFTE